ncbi:MAG TPA: hypothetical protein VMS00_10735, partial [Acidimicrobiales bacterium]|nr:hypothetical protein [Acidimicrobiales bacterium]
MDRIRRVRALGLGSVVVLAALAVVAAGASAAVPERGKCMGGGKEFEDKGCTVSGASDKFKWVPNVKKPFSAMSGAVTIRSFVGGTEVASVVCAKSKGKGDFIGLKGSELVITFEKCSSLGEACTGGGKAKAGQVVTNKLEGTLGFISPGVVGEDIKAVGGGALASFKCGSNSVEIDGSVIAEVGSGVYDTAAPTETLTFAQSAGKQEPSKLEGQPEDTLKAEINGLGGGSFPFATTVSATATVKPSLEIKTEEPSAAPKWWVEGSLLAGSEALAETTTVPPTEPFELNMTGKGIAMEPFTIRCTSV